MSDLTTYRRASSLAERAWDRVFREACHGRGASRVAHVNRTRWRRLTDRAAACLDRATAEADAFSEEVRRRG